MRVSTNGRRLPILVKLDHARETYDDALAAAGYGPGWKHQRACVRAFEDVFDYGAAAFRRNRQDLSVEVGEGGLELLLILNVGVATLDP